MTATKKYELLQDYKTPCGIIRKGVTETEEYWLCAFSLLRKGDCKIKSDWFREVVEKDWVWTDELACEWAGYLEEKIQLPSNLYKIPEILSQWKASKQNTNDAKESKEVTERMDFVSDGEMGMYFPKEPYTNEGKDENKYENNLKDSHKWTTQPDKQRIEVLAIEKTFQYSFESSDYRIILNTPEIPIEKHNAIKQSIEKILNGEYNVNTDGTWDFDSKKYILEDIENVEEKAFWAAKCGIVTEWGMGEFKTNNISPVNSIEEYRNHPEYKKYLERKHPHFKDYKKNLEK